MKYKLLSLEQIESEVDEQLKEKEVIEIRFNLNKKEDQRKFLIIKKVLKASKNTGLLSFLVNEKYQQISLTALSGGVNGGKGNISND